MRDVKFRAYVPWLNKMVDVFAVCPVNQTVYLSHQQLYDTPGDDVQFSYSDKVADDDRQTVILMQFTGRIDKHGKEIFEGDIVAKSGYPYFDNNEQNYVSVVEWIFAGFQTVYKCVNPAKRGISNGVNEPLESGEEFEIIGNIHENPELLESEAK